MNDNDMRMRNASTVKDDGKAWAINEKGVPFRVTAETVLAAMEQQRRELEIDGLRTRALDAGIAWTKATDDYCAGLTRCRGHEADEALRRDASAEIKARGDALAAFRALIAAETEARHERGGAGK